MPQTIAQTTTQVTSRRELAQRTGDGIQVRLLWQEHDDAIVVEVLDLFSDEMFEMSVPAGQARYAYEHPYAYAAQSGLDYDHVARCAA